MWGEVYYSCSNGWKVVTFVDGGGWDYIDHFVGPGGNVLDYDDMPNALQHYNPGRFCVDLKPSEVWGNYEGIDP